MKIAHISDLHVGKTKQKHLTSIHKSLKDEDVDLILATGDITDGGLKKEYKEFQTIFEDLIVSEKMIVVPGNHDRLGDRVGDKMMIRRVQVVQRPGVYIVCVDSTGPHNRLLLYGHGIICDLVLRDLDQALAAAPSDSLVIVMLHHHPLPLPTESFLEAFSVWVKWPFAKELHLGHRLIDTVMGRCDLLLHGHRHIPREFILPGPRPLRINNAGCTPALKKYKVFKQKAGKLVDIQWKEI